MPGGGAHAADLLDFPVFPAIRYLRSYRRLLSQVVPGAGRLVGIAHDARLPQERPAPVVEPTIGVAVAEHLQLRRAPVLGRLELLIPDVHHDGWPHLALTPAVRQDVPDDIAHFCRSHVTCAPLSRRS